ncbi:MAG: phage portal protein [Acetobacteraceae bacterium]|nr:phage portal protein [Acetobacteraceae bacterium]
MFETICRLIPQDSDYPARTRTLDILTRILDGRLYDVLPYEFHEERASSGEYIPLRSRRPNVRYNLARIVVEDSVSLLFSEGHFPRFDCTDKVLQGTLADIVKETRLNQLMTDAAIRGSVGSIAILVRVLSGRLFFDAMPTTYLTALWNPACPDALATVREAYKVAGTVLASNGYQIDDPTVTYWFVRQWDTEFETWYLPTPTTQGVPNAVDPARTVRHGLGFVPIVWIKNLPGGSSTGDKNDGGCTFGTAIESQIEIDYQLSQAGRGLKYSSDPTLLIKEPASSDSEIVKGAGNALIVTEKGDARLLEIGGSASAAVVDYVRTLREFALESVHGNRANPERLSAAQSGRAIELLNQGLLWLSDNLRISYGEIALLDLARMVVRASQIYPLQVFGKPIPAMDSTVRLSLQWPRWYVPTADDRQKDAQTLAALVESELISHETAVKAIAHNYDIGDIAAELSQLAEDQNTEASL